MKTILLTAVLLILIFHGGTLALSIHTHHIARARLLLHLLGDRFTVRAKVTPLWGIAQPVGKHVYCARIYSVSLQVAR